VTTTKFDTKDPSRSAKLSLLNYLKSNITNIEVVLDYPPEEKITPPLAMPIISIDYIAQGTSPLGISDEIGEEFVNGVVTTRYGNYFNINFLLDIWTDENTGGTATRDRLYGKLTELLGTTWGRQAFLNTVDMEITGFEGGSNVIETIPGNYASTKSMPANANQGLFRKKNISVSCRALIYKDVESPPVVDIRTLGTIQL
jgi:hypothetical protein